MKISRGHFTLRGALCAVAVISLLTGLLAGTVPTAGAVENRPGTAVVYPNTWYAYVNAGENLDVHFEKTRITPPGFSAGVPITVEGPGVVAQTCTFAQTDPIGTTCDFADLTSATSGIWRITLETQGGTVQAHFPGLFLDWGRYFWDIDVQLGATDVSGRVWSEKYTQAQATLFQDPTSLYDITFWYQTAFGVLYEATFHDYNGIHSAFAADPVGNRENGTCNAVYRSISFADPDRSPAAGDCGDGAFKLFFERPDPSLPATATTWDGGSDWLNPPEPAPPAINNLAFAANSSSVNSGTFSFDLVNFPNGPVTVRVDTNDDGSFVGPEDVSAAVGGPTSHREWVFDGINGLGAPIPPTQTIAFEVEIDRIAEIHFVNFDVETRSGFEIEQLTGPGSSDPVTSKTLSWDDSALSETTDISGSPVWTVTPTKQAQDVISGPTTHGWEWGPINVPVGWGNNRYIEDWKSVAIDEVTETATVAGRVGSFDVAKSSTPAEGTAVSPGDVVTYNVTVTNTSTAVPPAPPITVTGITVDDDLSDVLDDATLSGAPTATAGTVSVVGNDLTWTGDVVPGVPVTITYQVTVNDDADLGDLVLENLVSSTGSASCPPGDPGPACSTVHPVVVIGGAGQPSPSGDAPETEPATEVAGATEERSGTLPFTGGNLAVMVPLALAILGGGAFLVLLSRLRRRRIL